MPTGRFARFLMNGLEVPGMAARLTPPDPPPLFMPENLLLLIDGFGRLYPDGLTPILGPGMRAVPEAVVLSSPFVPGFSPVLPTGGWDGVCHRLLTRTTFAVQCYEVARIEWADTGSALARLDVTARVAPLWGFAVPAEFVASCTLAPGAAFSWRVLADRLADLDRPEAEARARQIADTIEQERYLVGRLPTDR